MKKLKLYRKILLIEFGVLATMTTHLLVTNQRGYKAVGGEFLIVPLIFIIYKIIQTLRTRWKVTEEYFKRIEHKKRASLAATRKTQGI